MTYDKHCATDIVIYRLNRGEKKIQVEKLEEQLILNPSFL